MDISKLKEAIKTIEESKWIEANPSSRLNADTIISLIDCAQRVIDAADVLPNKKEPTKQENDTLTYECYGEYNQAINECTAIVAKNYVRRDSLPTIEDIFDLCWKYAKPESPHPEARGVLYENDFKMLARAIHERVYNETK